MMIMMKSLKVCQLSAFPSHRAACQGPSGEGSRSLLAKTCFISIHVHGDPHRIDINHILSRPAVSGEVLQDHPKGKKPLVFMLTRKMQIICTTIMLDCLLGLIFLSSKSSMGF